MERRDISKGQELQCNAARFNRLGVERVTVQQTGMLFVLCAIHGAGEDSPLGTTVWLHPSELEPVPEPKPVSPQIIADTFRVTTAQGRVSGIEVLGPVDPAKPMPHKWQTPGRHKITSYRSFRRYKAAGAAFGVIPFESKTRSPEKDMVFLSVNQARRRAQQGLSLYAVVSA